MYDCSPRAAWRPGSTFCTAPASLRVPIPEMGENRRRCHFDDCSSSHFTSALTFRRSKSSARWTSCTYCCSWLFNCSTCFSASISFDLCRRLVHSLSTSSLVRRLFSAIAFSFMRFKWSVCVRSVSVSAVNSRTLSSFFRFSEWAVLQMRK